LDITTTYSTNNLVAETSKIYSKPLENSGIYVIYFTATLKTDTSENK
jgi:hypothetical protein